jgi:hypothetical protein
MDNTKTIDAGKARQQQGTGTQRDECIGNAVFLLFFVFLSMRQQSQSASLVRPGTFS